MKHQNERIIDLLNKGIPFRQVQRALGVTFTEVMAAYEVQKKKSNGL